MVEAEFEPVGFGLVYARSASLVSLSILVPNHHHPSLRSSFVVRFPAVCHPFSKVFKNLAVERPLNLQSTSDLTAWLPFFQLFFCRFFAVFSWPETRQFALDVADSLRLLSYSSSYLSD